MAFNPPLRVLVVIPTLNEVLHVERLVDQLLEPPPVGLSVSLVIVDGGSTDGTMQIAETLSLGRPCVSWLPNPGRIQSVAINLAARRFGKRADVLVRCDAHAEYPCRFLERLVLQLEASRADAVVVGMDSVGKSKLQQAVAWVCNSPIGTGGSAHRAGCRSGFVDHGHHAAFRMDTFRRAGGYDESFTHNEDAEFDCRQRAIGARVYLDATIRIEYHPRATWTALARQYFNYGLGRSRTLRRHPGSARLRQLAVPAHSLACAFALVISPRILFALLWPAAYLVVLATVSLYFAVKQRAFRGLLTGPAAAVIHLSWATGFLTGVFRTRERRWDSRTTAPLWLSREESS
jgi:succinoglycan biosynthesis protein ExoA